MISVLTYALLETTYKRFATVKDDPAALCNGVRMVGYFGVHTLFWMWPPLIILHYTKVEVFEWPSWEILQLMLLNAALDVAFNGFLFVCIALSSPLFATYVSSSGPTVYGNSFVYMEAKRCTFLLLSFSLIVANC